MPILGNMTEGLQDADNGQSPSQKSEIFDSPLYTRGPLRSWRIALRVYVLREEQRAMPAYEVSPVK